MYRCLLKDRQTKELMYVCMYGWMNRCREGEKELYDTNLYPKYAYTHVR